MNPKDARRPRPPADRLAHWHRDQDGAVAVTVAIVLVALIGTSMLAIDGGALWTSRRNLITDTDAAALAAVRVLVSEGCSPADQAAAQAAAAEVLLDNDANSVLAGPASIVCTSQAGRVQVTATRNTDLAFGGLAGVPDVDVASTSLAQYGQVTSMARIRPIGLCSQDPHFLDFSRLRGHIDDQGIVDLLGGQEGIDLLAAVNAVAANVAEHPTSGPDGAYPPGNLVHRTWFSRAAVATGCGDAPGNWGWLDFDSGGGGNNELLDRLRDGYDRAVTVGPNVDCAPELNNENDCPSKTGAGGGSFNSTLRDIYCPSNLGEAECIAAGKTFPIIVFDDLTGNGGGARYHPTAFLGVIVRGWSSVTGNPNNQSYFDFQFVDPFITNGTISSSPSAAGPGAVAIQLCGGGVEAATDDFCVVP